MTIASKAFGENLVIDGFISINHTFYREVGFNMFPTGLSIDRAASMAI